MGKLKKQRISLLKGFQHWYIYPKIFLKDFSSDTFLFCLLILLVTFFLMSRKDYMLHVQKKEFLSNGKAR